MPNEAELQEAVLKLAEMQSKKNRFKQNFLKIFGSMIITIALAYLFGIFFG